MNIVTIAGLLSKEPYIISDDNGASQIRIVIETDESKQIECILPENLYRNCKENLIKGRYVGVSASLETATIENIDIDTYELHTQSLTIL